MSDLDAAWQQLAARIDLFFADVQARNAEHMQCRAGCDACCQQRLSFFPYEAERMRDALSALDDDAQARAQARAQSEQPTCPMLEDSRCVVYADRPLLCRSHGVPALEPAETEDPEEERTVEICPLNFQGVTELGPEDILDLDVVNRALATLDLMHRRSMDPSDPWRELARVPVEEIVRAATARSDP